MTFLGLISAGNVCVSVTHRDVFNIELFNHKVVYGPC